MLGKSRLRKLGPVAVLFLLGCAGAASGASLTLTPSSPTVNLGSNVSIDLGITGLGDGTSPSLGVFDLFVQFQSPFSFSSVTFGDPTLGDQLDLSSSGSFTSFTPAVGNVELIEVSFDDPSTLISAQHSSFVLARLIFQAIAPGSGVFSLNNVVLGDELGNELVPDALGQTTVRVTSVTTPEPSSFVLVVLACIILGSARVVLTRQRD